MSLVRQIAAARADEPSDLLIRNTKIVNVFSGRVREGSVAVKEGLVVGFGDRPAKTVLDLRGRHLLPGLMDAHIHVESTMATPAAFGRAAVVRGTSAVVADPHEIANVMGTTGLDFMLESAGGSPMDIFFMASSCVPATDMETSGARLSAEDLEPYLSHPRFLGLAEMMNFPGVVHGEPEVLEKIGAARALGKRLDGHAPLLSGKDLDAYLTAGMASDHECTSLAEAREKLEKGMRIMIREGSTEKDLETLLPLVNGRNIRRVMFCSDDRNPRAFLDIGHMDSILKKAVALGMDPVLAVIAATLNTAEYFGLRDRGAVAPGRRADLVAVSDLAEFRAEKVFIAGELVAENGSLVKNDPPSRIPVPRSMNVRPGPLDFSIPAPSKRARVILLVPDRILTRGRVENVPVAGGLAQADPSQDILKLAVIERHRATGNIGLGFVSGFGLKQGAFASSVAHDSHNVIVAGADDRSMETAARAVIEQGGGLAVALEERVLGTLSLPVAGLMSEDPMETTRKSLGRLRALVRELGGAADDPFMELSFLALPVIPELKLTDRGLVDVGKFDFVPLFV